MNTEPEKTQAKPLPINILAQYVKDLSFENPNAPDSLKSNAASPNMDVQVSLESAPRTEAGFENLHEVTLRLVAKATRPEQTVFIAEMKYGALVSLPGVPEDKQPAILLVEIPHLMFPFARQILANAISAGGFPPVYLNPIDFAALFRERFAQQMGSVTTA